MAVRSTHGSTSSNGIIANQTKKGMVLPFQPLSLAFNHVNYYVDMPTVSHFYKALYLKCPFDNIVNYALEISHLYIFVAGLTRK